MRYGVAPHPTGSSTQGFPRALACLAASFLDATHSEDSVPMLMSTAEEMDAKASTSSTLCTCNG